MCSLLLKKALPFALTLLLGSFIGGLFKSVGFGGQKTERSRAYFYGYGEGHSCRMHARHRDLVAETKPLTILFKPDAALPLDFKGEKGGFVPVSVTFGADGAVQKVEASPQYTLYDVELPPRPMWAAVVKAAQQIRFTPETVDGVPVTVTKDVEIRFMD